MASADTDMNAIQAALSAFQGLKVDDRLAVLATLYGQIASKIPADVKNALPAQNATNLVARIEQLPSEEQLSALRTLLPAEPSDKNAVVLDPNPSKALTELVTGGGTSIPTEEYGSFNAESKLAFWYTLAGKLGSSIIGIPSGTKPTQESTQVLSLLESMNTDQLVSFLRLMV